MIERIYRANVYFPDGVELTNKGTLEEVAQWAENQTRGRGSCNVEIRLTDQKKKQKKKEDILK